MRIKKFFYTKKDNSVSLRTVAVVQLPCKYVTGYDMSELSEAEQEAFALRHNELMDKFAAARDGLLAEFDLTHSYRQFVEDKIESKEEDKFV